MSGTVLITTHDLSLAGPLRDGFQAEGYAVELLTVGEDPRTVEDPVLLVLTGATPVDAARDLVRIVRTDLGIPAFAVLSAAEEAALGEAYRLNEVFHPPADFDEVLLLGRTAIGRVRLQEATGIVGETDAMVEVLERVVQIAPVGATVLITGESGTGKELVARGIHALSPRRHQAFIPVNVAALSETLLESELFGHEKGAFTGAIDARKGLFELADGGTIFLDEIGEMPLQTQTKLLRVLEQQEFLRVGGEVPIRVDVRIIAATNQRLQQLVTVGEFRKDLYYRLNVLNISLPPLRHRRDDIPRLVHAFILEASERHDREFLGISDEAMAILTEHRWPGNVRELRNLVESMVVLAPGRVIEAADIPKEVRVGERSAALVPTAPVRGDLVADATLRPQLEFLFRSMMELKVDIDDLKREFEAFRREESRSRPLLYPVSPEPHREEVVSGFREVEVAVEAEPGEGADVLDHSAPHAGRSAVELLAGPPAARAVVYEPGMTMEDLEREAIRIALAEVRGNRRKAAENLGIGERTLYRKIKKFGLDD